MTTDEHAYDPIWTTTHPYATIRAGEYRMGADYRIRRPDGSSDDLLFCTVSGRGVFRSADGETFAEPGFLYRYAPGTPQDYGTDPATGRWHFLWCHFHASVNWQPLLDGEPCQAGVSRFDLSSLPDKDRRTVLRAFRSAVAYALAPGALEDELAMNHIEHALLLCRRARLLESGRDTAFVEAIRVHVMRNLRNPLNTSELARVVRLSPSRMSHRFRDVTGMTPQAFVEMCRLEFARRLLTTESASVKEAAYEAGFDAPAYFSRRFSLRFGLPPSSISRG